MRFKCSMVLKQTVWRNNAKREHLLFRIQYLAQYFIPDYRFFIYIFGVRFQKIQRIIAVSIGIADVGYDYLSDNARTYFIPV